MRESIKLKKEAFKKTIKLFKKFINLIELTKEPTKITLSKNGLETIECEYNPNTRKWIFREKIGEKITKEGEATDEKDLIKKIKTKYYEPLKQ